MLIGAMNHPCRDVLQEIECIAAMRMGFVDLTLEPPAAASWKVDPRAVRAKLEEHNLKVVGHTPFYLPLASAIEGIRRAAAAELRQCLKVFSFLGASWMNVHLDRYTPMHDRRFYVSRNIQTIQELLPAAQDLGLGLMIENLPGDFNNATQLADILDAIPALGLHIDIGHANLEVPENTTEEILAMYGSRLRHVHLHDNRGGNADLHLPLGAGTVDVRRAVRALKSSGYDGTITLEVFTPDRHHLAYSRDVLQRMWNEPVQSSGNTL
jgi:sugar phosphate isomerase/epimerase